MSRGRSYTYERIDRKMEALDDWYDDLLKKNMEPPVGQDTGGNTEGNTGQEENIPEPVYKYKVGDGENLLVVSVKFHVGPSVISGMNNLGRPIQAGDIITLPGYAVNVRPFDKSQEQQGNQNQQTTNSGNVSGEGNQNN